MRTIYVKSEYVKQELISHFCPSDFDPNAIELDDPCCGECIDCWHESGITWEVANG